MYIYIAREVIVEPSVATSYTRSQLMIHLSSNRNQVEPLCDPPLNGHLVCSYESAIFIILDDGDAQVC